MIFIRIAWQGAARTFDGSHTWSRTYMIHGCKGETCGASYCNPLVQYVQYALGIVFVNTYHEAKQTGKNQNNFRASS